MSLRLQINFCLTCLFLTLFLLSCDSNAGDEVRKVPVIFSGGYQTNPMDKGRPVNLVAGALEVKPEIFRKAFSKVQPAPGGTKPTKQRERMNKKVLMDALGPHGVTNKRLDEVSNYYRYRPQRGEMWPITKANANAIFKDGKLAGFEIIEGGAGFNSIPQVKIKGYEKYQLIVEMGYSKDFSKNGSVTKITLKIASSQSSKPIQ